MVSIIQSTISKETLCLIVISLGKALARDLFLFQKQMTKYTEAYIQALLAMGVKVDALPDIKKRLSIRKNARIALVQLLPTVLINAKSAERYIAELFPGPGLEERLVEAGIKTNYRGASSKNWTSAKNMLTNLIAFVTKNEADLIAKGSMPTTFLADLALIDKDFNVAFKTFETANSDLENESMVIATEINTLYTQVVGIFADAQAVFVTDAEKRNYYTLANFKRQVQPPKAGGINGGLINALNQRPIDEANISMAYFDKAVVSNKKGRFSFYGLPEGVYTIKVEAAGFPVYTLTDILVQTSVARRLPVIALPPIVAGNPDSAKPITVKWTPDFGKV